MIARRAEAYRSIGSVLQEATRGQVLLGAMASPHEYAVVDHAEIRARIRETGIRIEPSSVFSYPARSLGFMQRDGMFSALLPDRDSMKQFAIGAQQVAEHYHLGRFEPIWGPDPLRGDNGTPPIDVFETALSEMAPDIAEQIRRLYPLTAQFAAVQHANTPEGRQFQDVLAGQGINVSSIFGDKSYDYPNVGDRSGFTDFARLHNLPAAYARVAMSPEEFAAAYQDVTQHNGHNLVFMKLAGSGGGYAVRAVRSEDEVIQVAREWTGFGMFGPLYGHTIPVEFQSPIPGISDELTLSFQYSHGSITTPTRREARINGHEIDAAFTIQMMHGVDWIGNAYGTQLPITNDVDRKNAYRVIGEMQRTFMDVCSQTLGSAWENATGGVDFALIDLQGQVERGELTMDQARDLMGGFWSHVFDDATGSFTSRYAPVIIEHNGLRLSDATPPAAFAETLGIEKEYMATKILTVSSHLTDAWRYITENGMQFDPLNQDKGGIVPIAWIHDNEYGVHYANVIIVPKQGESLTAARERIFTQLSNAGLIG